jgi:hypothetical protein
MIAKGRELADNPNLQDEKALVLAKLYFDSEITGLKQAAGNPTPPRNAGLPVAGGGFAEGGEVWNLEPLKTWGHPELAEQPAGPAGPAGIKPPVTSVPIAEQPAGIKPPVTSVPIAEQPAAPAPAGPAKTLFKVSAGDTATGYAPAATVTDRNVAGLTAEKQANGVTANGQGTNKPDFASIISDIGTGTDVSQGDEANPSVIVHRPLDPKAADRLNDKVDWSAGSKNIAGLEAASKSAEEKRLSNWQSAPKTLAQHLNDIKSNNTTWDLPPAQQAAMAQEQFDREHDIAKEKTTAGLEAARIKALGTLNQGNMGLKKEGLDIKKADLERKKEADKSLKDYRDQVVKAKAAMGTGVVSAMSSEAKTMLAKDFLLKGQLPPMSRGHEGQADFRAIMDEVAALRQTAGSKPEEVLVRQAAIKASSHALGQLETQKGKVMAFANTIDPMLTRVEELSRKVGNGGIPIYNRFKNATKNQIANDPELSAYSAQIQLAATEAAKIISSPTGGSVVSDSARKEMQEIFNVSQTPEQISRVVKLIRSDIASRRDGFDQEIGHIKDSIMGNPQGQQAGVPSGGASSGVPKIDMSKPRNNDKMNGYLQPDGSIVDQSGKRLN